jgi:hypothetical protein
MSSHIAGEVNRELLSPFSSTSNLHATNSIIRIVQSSLDCGPVRCGNSAEHNPLGVTDSMTVPRGFECGKWGPANNQRNLVFYGLYIGEFITCWGLVIKCASWLNAKHFHMSPKICMRFPEYTTTTSITAINFKIAIWFFSL